MHGTLWQDSTKINKRQLWSKSLNVSWIMLLQPLMKCFCKSDHLATKVSNLDRSFKETSWTALFQHSATRVFYGNSPAYSFVNMVVAGGPLPSHNKVNVGYQPVNMPLLVYLLILILILSHSGPDLACLLGLYNENLTHLAQVLHICLSELYQHWFR